ncbi:MAG: hypothetical protein ACLSC9_13085 [Barnesiella sp.]
MKFFIVLIVIFMSVTFSVFSINDIADFKVRSIERRIVEYKDTFDLSSPLNSFLTFEYLIVNGKRGLQREASSYRIKSYMAKSGAPAVQINESKRNGILHRTIREVWTYKDSVAAVITDYVDSLCLIRFMSCEDGKWLNAGEDMSVTLLNARNVVREKSHNFLSMLRRVQCLKYVPSDTLSFVNYLNEAGMEPEDYLLRMMEKHKLLIYGEVHRRRISWELMKRVISDPRFYKTTGTVYMELSTDKQKELDRFFDNETIKPDIILSIFQDVQINGWYDRGMYEFILELWKLNKSLSPKDRIRVVAVDMPRPFSSLYSKEEYSDFFDNTEDRNNWMADQIERDMRSAIHTQSHLFIVGCAHAYKSSVPGIASAASGEDARLTVAAQLAGRFKQEDVFTVFSHTAIISNNGVIHGKIRHGVFDYAFMRTGYKPVAFSLQKSPFGMEPFDGIYEISYNESAGNYVDNFDGYIFLEPLENEEAEYILYDIFTDDYVQELKRRAVISDSEHERWYGLPVKDLTKEAIISNLKKATEGKKRWEALFR